MMAWTARCIVLALVVALCPSWASESPRAGPQPRAASTDIVEASTDVNAATGVVLVANAQRLQPPDTFDVSMYCRNTYADNDTAHSCPNEGHLHCGDVSKRSQLRTGGGMARFILPGLPGDELCRTLLLLPPFCSVAVGDRYECVSDTCTASAWSEWSTCQGLCGEGVQLRNRTLSILPVAADASSFQYCLQVVDELPCALRECETPGLDPQIVQWIVIVSVIFGLLFMAPLVGRVYRGRNAKARPARPEGRFSHALRGDDGDQSREHPERRSRRRDAPEARSSRSDGENDGHRGGDGGSGADGDGGRGGGGDSGDGAGAAGYAPRGGGRTAPPAKPAPWSGDDVENPEEPPAVAVTDATPYDAKQRHGIKPRSGAGAVRQVRGAANRRRVVPRTVPEDGDADGGAAGAGTSAYVELSDVRDVVPHAAGGSAAGRGDVSARSMDTVTTASTAIRTARSP